MIDENDLEKIETDYGNIFYVPKKDVFIMKRFILHKPFQYANIKYIHKLLKINRKKARTIIDIGANIGCNSIQYSKIADEVYAFEPSPMAYFLLCKNLETNNVSDNIIKYNVALGDNNGSIEFREDKVKLGLSSINHDGECKRREHIIIVDLNKLDDYNINNIDFIKIDTEGFEYDIIKGGYNTIIKNRPIIQLEINEEFCKKYDYSPNDIFEFFKKIKYKCFINTGKEYNKWRMIKGKGDRFFVPGELCEKNIYDFDKTNTGE
jgi:FkbM family methyltransferase